MDPHERIPHDDWADQDLLTKGEAVERVTAEIQEIGDRLDGVESGDEILQRRLATLQSALREMQAQYVNRANEVIE
jgi:chaperonin cofactor prefoldin